MEITEVIAQLNGMIEARQQLLALYGPQIEMVFKNGHVHDCAIMPESNIYFRGKLQSDTYENVIPLRRR